MACRLQRPLYLLEVGAACVEQGTECEASVMAVHVRGSNASLYMQQDGQDGSVSLLVHAPGMPSKPSVHAGAWTRFMYPVRVL
jgi:hypothetical protein